MKNNQWQQQQIQRNQQNQQQAKGYSWWRAQQEMLKRKSLFGRQPKGIPNQSDMGKFRPTNHSEPTKDLLKDGSRPHRPCLICRGTGKVAAHTPRYRLLTKRTGGNVEWIPCWACSKK